MMGEDSELQSSRLNQLIIRLRSLDLPKPFDFARLTTANRDFAEKLSHLKSCKMTSQFALPASSYAQPKFPAANLSSLRWANFVEEKKLAPPEGDVGLYVLPYRPARPPAYLQDFNKSLEKRMVRLAMKQSKLKVKEWLKNNSKFILRANDQKSTRPRKPKKGKKKTTLPLSGWCSSIDDSEYFDGISPAESEDGRSPAASESS